MDVDIDMDTDELLLDCDTTNFDTIRWNQRDCERNKEWTDRDRQITKQANKLICTHTYRISLCPFLSSHSLASLLNHRKSFSLATVMDEVRGFWAGQRRMHNFVVLNGKPITALVRNQYYDLNLKLFGFIYCYINCERRDGSCFTFIARVRTEFHIKHDEIGSESTRNKTWMGNSLI
jgi:hypothetical protein